jgi:molecular chaperone HtpG
MAKKQFKAESKKVLDLMVNSIYTHKEIFLRELISNASDAIDKLCYLALTDPSVGMNRSDFEIRLAVDKDARTLTVSDNGIGMSAEELEKNLGTIAFSGSGAFKAGLSKDGEKPAEAENPIDIIGQFGVGFYSAFMVADHITVVSKKYGETEAHKWESDGADGFTVTPCEKETAGTDVILHIRPDGEEADEFSQYVREYPIYKLVKKYSDYVRYPIRMLMPHPYLKEGTGIKKEDGTDVPPEYEEKWELETFNSMVPIWRRKKADVKPEEYEAFYQETFRETEPPLRTIPVSVEGAITYDALLFIPKKAPANYFSDEYKSGLQLYSSGVMIMDSCEDLLPDYFNFVRGVVESPDLTLNISREVLQHDRQLKSIGAHLEKKIRAELDKMLADDRESYEAFWKEFGRQIKVCCLEDYGAKKDQLEDLLMFYSSKEKKFVKLEEYFSRMKPDQKYIYFAAGETVEAIDRKPQTEILKDRDFEILYFTEPMDEFVADMFRNYKDKPFRSALDGDLELPEDKEKDKPDESGLYRDTLDFIKNALGDKVDEVKASNKLISHPVCMSSGDGVTFEMERYFKAVGQEMPVKAKRILEINTNHAAFRAIENVRVINPEKAKKYCEILYTQAMMIAGMPVEDPSAYTDLLTSLW